MNISKSNTKGFSMLELLLVVVIMSTMMLVLIRFSTLKTDQVRRERTAAQIQQIVNATVAYYLANGQWPIAAACPGGDTFNGGNQILQTAGYLPAVSIVNPWGGAYALMCDANHRVTVYTSTQTDSASGLIIAGMLPMASTATGGAPHTEITVYIPTPAQKLNNARAVNFASIYNSSQCVPVPTCPQGMVAQIMVAPSAVAGTYEQTNNAYNIESFQAYVTQDSPAANPGACTAGTPFDNCTHYGAGNYWRVCLSVLTPQGLVTPTTTSGNELMGNILAITRCVPAAEPPGSTVGNWH